MIVFRNRQKTKVCSKSSKLSKKQRKLPLRPRRKSTAKCLANLIGTWNVITLESTHCNSLTRFTCNKVNVKIEFWKRFIAYDDE